MKMSSSLEKRLQTIEDKLDKIIGRRTHGNRPQKTHGMKKIAVRTKNDWSLFLRYTYIFITFLDYRIYVQNIFSFISRIVNYMNASFSLSKDLTLWLAMVPKLLASKGVFTGEVLHISSDSCCLFVLCQPTLRSHPKVTWLSLLMPII